MKIELVDTPSSPLKTLHVVTGPLAAGKTTFRKSLCKKLKTKSVPEYQKGLDLSDKRSWANLQKSANSNKTTVVEVHFNYEGKDPGDYGAVLGDFAPIPANVIVYIIIPPFSTLLKRQCDRFNENVEDAVSRDAAQTDIDWYSEISKRLPSNQVRLITS